MPASLSRRKVSQGCSNFFPSHKPCRDINVVAMNFKNILAKKGLNLIAGRYISYEVIIIDRRCLTAKFFFFTFHSNPFTHSDFEASSEDNDSTLYWYRLRWVQKYSIINGYLLTHLNKTLNYSETLHRFNILVGTLLSKVCFVIQRLRSQGSLTWLFTLFPPPLNNGHQSKVIPRLGQHLYIK